MYAKLLHAVVVTLVGASLFSTAAPTQAQTAWISDELTVPLRSGPSNEYRIVHAGLPSGTEFEVLTTDEASGFSQIRTERGTEAWIRTRYLSDEPIAKLKLAAANEQVAKLQSDLSRIMEANKTMTAENFRIALLEEELAEIKQVSSAAIELNNRNKQLQETNTRLRDELDDLAEANARAEDNEYNQALMIGAGLIFAGLLAGVLIKARPQRSAWN